jgi:flavodoxin
MAAGTAVMLSGCSTKSSNKTESTDNPAAEKVLVLYYSQTGATKTVAEEIKTELGADIAQIEPVIAYPDSYDETISRWRAELESGELPAIKDLNVNLDDYSTIFLGFPIWGGTYALPVATFLSQNKLEGKKVVTFATFGSGGINEATDKLARALPDADVVLGYGVRNARIDKAPVEIKRFLRENGYIDGTVDPLPEYSNAVAVTDEDVKIFNAACDGYKFPLGTPLTVGKRTTKNSTDYKFNVEGQMPDGTQSQSTIYITVENGGKPEFTLVDRSK